MKEYRMTHVGEEDAADEQSGQGDAVRDLFDCRAGGS